MKMAKLPKMIQVSIRYKGIKYMQSYSIHISALCGKIMLRVFHVDKLICVLLVANKTV